MSKKSSCIDIAFCINDVYARHLMVTMFSIIKNNDMEVRFHILSSDLKDDTKQLINILSDINNRIDIKYYKIDSRKFSRLPITMNYISRETYYRLILPEIIPNTIDKILYLDADIIVDGPIGELYSTDLNEYYAAGAPDVYLDKDNEHKALINMTSEEIYVNAGVMLFNLGLMRREAVSEKLMGFAAKGGYKYQDQDILNGSLRGRMLALDTIYNAQLKDDEYELIPKPRPKIIHYSGSLKPWNRDRKYDILSTKYDKYKINLTKLMSQYANKVKYGLLKYSTDNVGDSVQGLAARRFMPKVDYYFERDFMDGTKVESGDVVKVIMNGWWGNGPENWPPLDQNLDLLPISMYIEDRIQDEFRKPRSVQLLNNFGPVGARSYGSKAFLESIGVKSYFSGCLTLTLKPDERIVRQDYILAVDVPDSVYETMLKSTQRRIIRAGVLRPISTDENEQYRLAELYLSSYQSAHAVVTTRLHAMLPCLSLGTPVLFINDILDGDDVRFSGLSNFARSMKAEDYVSNPNLFDIDRPPANKNDYKKISAFLEKKCFEFTGYDSKKSYAMTDLSTITTDPDLLQAVLRGSSEYGDLKEAKDIVDVKLTHKESHVVELAKELSEAKEDLIKKTAEIDGIITSISWKATRPIRLIKRAFRAIVKR